jgi:hypothetical protein
MMYGGNRPRRQLNAQAGSVQSKLRLLIERLRTGDPSDILTLTAETLDALGPREWLKAVGGTPAAAMVIETTRLVNNAMCDDDDIWDELTERVCGWVKDLLDAELGSAPDRREMDRRIRAYPGMKWCQLLDEEGRVHTFEQQVQALRATIREEATSLFSSFYHENAADLNATHGLRIPSEQECESKFQLIMTRVEEARDYDHFETMARDLL